jgi:hypothetical protein
VHRWKKSFDVSGWTVPWELPLTPSLEANEEEVQPGNEARAGQQTRQRRQQLAEAEDQAYQATSNYHQDDDSSEQERQFIALAQTTVVGWGTIPEIHRTPSVAVGTGASSPITCRGPDSRAMLPSQMERYIDDSPLKALMASTIEKSGSDQPGRLSVKQILPPCSRDKLGQDHRSQLSVIMLQVGLV